MTQYSNTHYHSSDANQHPMVNEPGRSDTEFSFEQRPSFLNIEVQNEHNEVIAYNNNGVSIDHPKREKSFRNFFKKKPAPSSSSSRRSSPVKATQSSEGPLGIEDDLNALKINTASRQNLQIPSPLSPNLSIASDASFRSDDESSLTASSTSKISTKWKMMRNNFDKNEEHDHKSMMISKYLMDHYYDSDNFNWEEISEIYLFGGVVSHVFSKKGVSLTTKKQCNVLMNWLLLGGDKYGEETFLLDHEFIDNIDIYTLEDSKQLALLLKYFAPLVKTLDLFKQAVSFFKENTDNNEKLKEKSNNVKVLESVSNKRGFPIPLSQALYANWLIQFTDGAANDEFSSQQKFQDQDVMRYFRRSARNSLVLKILHNSHYFDGLLDYLKEAERKNPTGSIPTSISVYAPSLASMNTSITNQELNMFVSTFVEKDNQTSLGLALYGIANSCHVQKYFNKAINIFELSAHLSFDRDCCLMAVEGLSNGYGFGKKHGKESKFHRKRRLAHIYRIMKTRHGESDVGSSWAFKSKYD
ncbi:hypothetical protein DASC09_007220 [Saccharomycopsis crataegensis]|uniref:Uncharacterized protein n=1 Tax=Saccharomycopsis crataegensis TaxID=43959 RepID=A0AAV5QFF9_9ASCO|nr:hypothetical protein DASC09_007220 [Saccharomycopsis crataegensis]